MAAPNDPLERLVDLVLPVLTPYQLSVYLYLLRHGADHGGERHVRIGKRTIAIGLGRGSRSPQGNYQQISEKLTELATLGFIRIGDTSRDGTQYWIVPLEEVPAVTERLEAVGAELEPPPNYFRDPALRTSLFERDKWRCRYCGDRVGPDTAALDHIVPVSKGGSDAPQNLATCCLTCNSIKAGQSYEQAAPRILKALRARRLDLAEAGSSVQSRSI